MAAKKDCTTCKHAKWETTPSGRRKLEFGGECTVTIKFPNSYLDRYSHAKHFPSKNIISKYTPDECSFWEKRSSDYAEKQTKE